MATEKNLEYFKGLVNKSIKKYVVMTIVGCVLITIGLAIMLTSIGLGYDPQNPKSNDPNAALFIIGLVILAGPGAALTDVGTPCWIAMGVQIKVARNKLGMTNTSKEKPEVKQVEQKVVEPETKPVAVATKTTTATPKAKVASKTKSVKPAVTSKKPVKVSKPAAVKTVKKTAKKKK